MPELDDIVQKVTLGGQAEVVEGLRGIEDAGKRVFEALRSESGVEAFAGLAAGVALAGAALAAFTVSMSQSIVEQGHLAEQLGTNIEEFSAMRAAFGTLGVNTENFGTQFKHLSKQLSEDWPDIVKQFEDGGQSIAKAQNDAAIAANNYAKVSGNATASVIGDQLKITQARIAAEDARKKADAAVLRDVPTIAAAISGQGQAIELSSVKIADLYKAVEANAGKAAAAAKGLGENVKIPPDGITLLKTLADTVQKIEDPMQRTALLVKAFGRSVDQELVQAFAKGSANLEQLTQKMKAAGISLSDLDLEAGEKAKQAFDNASVAIGTAAEKLVVSFAPAVAGALTALAAFPQNLSNIIQWLSQFVTKVDQADQAIKKLGGDMNIPGLSGNSDNFTGHADGGLISGPGNDRSDNILARLSPGEYVQRAQAVRFWGADFMHAINSMQMPKFASGGIVGGGPVQSASGDSSGGRRTVNLTIMGEKFHGLSAPESVAKHLESFAIRKSIASTGVKPRWVR